MTNTVTSNRRFYPMAAVVLVIAILMSVLPASAGPNSSEITAVVNAVSTNPGSFAFELSGTASLASAVGAVGEIVSFDSLTAGTYQLSVSTGSSEVGTRSCGSSAIGIDLGSMTMDASGSTYSRSVVVDLPAGASMACSFDLK